MKTITIFIWSIMVVIGSMALIMALKKNGRKIGKFEMLFKLLFVALSFIISYFLFAYLYEEESQLIWVSRACFFVLGIFAVWVMYRRSWSIRNTLEHKDDSFLPEFIYIFIGSFLNSIAFVSVPKIFYDNLNIDLSIDISKMFWELPIYYVIPFVAFKLYDLVGQVPPRVIENPWVYPLEPIDPGKLPWRDLMQVNFVVKRSLLEENDLYTWHVQPWIEAPKESPLGPIFQLCIQERRDRKGLTTIQDLGDEYGGTPKFCWLFKRMNVWYDPSTWFRKPRYLDPNRSLTKNNITKGDVIVAKRIPGDGSRSFYSNDIDEIDDDPNRTVIIKR